MAEKQYCLCGRPLVSHVCTSPECDFSPIKVRGGVWVTTAGVAGSAFTSPNTS